MGRRVADAVGAEVNPELMGHVIDNPVHKVTASTGHSGLQDVVPRRADLARYTSYRSRLPATARFRESATPTIGMRTRHEQRSRWTGVSPWRSSPRIRIVGRG